MPASEHPTGHDLIAIDTWLPGSMPTSASEAFPRGDEYRTRFWRCRACGAERRGPDEFETVCPGGSTLAVVTDGGSSAEEPERATSAKLTVQFVEFGPGYGVVTPDGTRLIVDIEARSCGCAEHRETSEECEHLARVDQAIRTGELPGPDGRYVA